MYNYRQLLFKHFSTFRFKLKLAFILTSMVPLILSIATAFTIINRYLDQEARQTLSSSADLEVQQIEAHLRQMVSLQDSLSAYFSTVLTSNNTKEKEISSASLAQFQALRTNIAGLEYVYGVDRIRIYSDAIPFTSGDDFRFFPLSDMDPSLLDQITGNFSGINHLNYFFDRTNSSVHFYKMLKNIKGEITAIYFIDTNLGKTINQFLPSDQSSVTLSVLENEEMLYCNDSAPVTELLRFALQLSPNQVHSSKENCFLLKKDSLLADWTYVFLAPQKNLNKINLTLLAGYFMVFAFTIILCFIAIMFFPNAFSKRIKHFSEIINNIDDKELTSSTQTCNILKSLTRNTLYTDEIDDIISSFGELFRKNMVLQHSVQDHLIEIEKSKFRILQEQINPHFLYNSLDTIRICMLMGKKETACHLITTLSQFYRISLSKGKDIISVKEELDMVTAYLQIEYIGYDERIQWNFSYPSEVLDYGIPKFTLQPIIENSIVHSNFSDPDFILIIDISIVIDETVTIIISDNGPGISQEHIAEINARLTAGHLTSTKNYGLQNCCQRIHLHYGNAYGIQLLDVPHGSCTRITLPIDNQPVEHHV